MSTKFISTLLSLVLSLSLGFSTESSARPLRAATGLATICTALLATTTAGAVVVTKVMGTNPMGSYTSRLRNFNDRHALLVFLGNALGGRFAEKMNVDAKVEMAQFDSPPDEESQILSRLAAAGLTEEQVVQAITFDKVDTEAGKATGFFILKGVVARFNIFTTPAGTQEFKVRDLIQNKILFQGAWKLKLT